MLEQPWARVKNPTPIPAAVDAARLHELDDIAFAELLRDNLLPRTPAVRGEWQRLWDVLFDDDDLANRAFDVLESFLGQITALRSSPDIDEVALKRSKKFELHVEAAWSRLQNTDRLPAPTVVRRLVFAITKHRALTRQHDEVTDHDEELWRTLSRLGLDPEQRETT